MADAGSLLRAALRAEGFHLVEFYAEHGSDPARYVYQHGTRVCVVEGDCIVDETDVDEAYDPHVLPPEARW